MIRDDSSYTMALGERVRLQNDLAKAGPDLTIVFGETLRRNLARVTAEIEAYERSMKKSIGQMTFDERLGNEPLVK